MRKRTTNRNWKFRTEGVYQFLKKKLISMEFKPGQLLSEKEIVSRFKLSRTPVRQALFRMERDGLIEIIPRKGAFVKFLSMKDIKELYQVRKALEGMAARIAAENIDLDALKEYENFYLNALKENSNQSLQEIVDFGLKFHNFIIDSADNQRIKNILKDLRVQLEISRMFFLNPSPSAQPSRGLQSINEHLAIIEALKKRDSELVEARMREHIVNAEKYIFSF